ncbi:hypothetical protein IVB38_34590 [Bradyrhizobium sp. 38]|uniref:hypothetical protein n=1 Tax=unclassified Bradyrhizobium TaxID=2631580 RepID=UPI001FFAAF2F|nr:MULTISPECIES: hypothetical protein [unclassified Bradyrhizobium]MCK1341009.1 hypothetical protein [Bradyrhizobium sp. 38]MCK1780982.1 hypothetical protein [Bradyrhizobium sp. 132]
MRAIISAIISALKSAFGVAAAVLVAPFRYLASMTGGGQAAPPEMRMPEPIESAPARVDMTKMYDEIAAAIMSWSVDSIIADGPVAAPPKAPREVREWLQGLTRDECAVLMESDKMSISSHLIGLFSIPGVRKVQPLTVTAWPAEPVSFGSAGFAAIAALEAIEPDRA